MAEPHDNVISCDNLTTQEMVALAAAMEWSRHVGPATPEFGTRFAQVYLDALRRLGAGLTSE